MGILLGDPADSAVYTFDWADALSAGETIGVVEHTVPAPLVRVDQTTDVPNAKSNVKVSGGMHGGAYLIEAQTTTNLGNTINRQGLLRVFNG